ncbi:hypothetical protein E9531_04375 [Lampropedia puyangensis]|uniref:DUF3352 domain-containing protein n=1 Tax=Lampropedia puyangensis TaxID=1330072 RepID=A0A4S8FAU4_9BURK|nr:hypothetical protein [Lampropedia puyangensis]THU03975.1 hypothetical protein E9531_04375 [Lampropedia puyangensis]
MQAKPKTTGVFNRFRHHTASVWRCHLAIAASVSVLMGCAANAPEHPLAFAPEQSLYVAANLAPPSEQAQVFSQTATQPLKAIWTQWYPILRKSWLQEEPENSSVVFLDYVNDTLSTQGMAGLGFNSPTYYALYEVDLHPVLRISLKEPEKLRTFIAKWEKSTNQVFTPQTLDGTTYWRVPLSSLQPDNLAEKVEALKQRSEELEQWPNLDAIPDLDNIPNLPVPAAPNTEKALDVVFAINDHYAIITLQSVNDDTPLPLLLGQQKPKRSIWDAQTLQQVNTRHSLSPYGTFWLDTSRLLPLLGIPAAPQSPQPESPHDRSLLKTPLSAACQREITLLASHMPEVVAGTTQVDAKQLHAKLALALTPEIRQDLQRLQAPLPGWDAAPNLMEVGVSLRLDQLANIVQKYIQRIQAQPWECEWFEPLNQLVQSPKSIQVLAPLYAAGNTATGMYMRATGLTMQDDTPIPEGVLLAASPNPRALFAYLSMAIPELGKLNVQPGMAPQQITLPEGQWNTANLPVWVGMSEQAVGVALGVSAKSELEHLLQQHTSGNSPLTFSRYSGTLFADVLQPIMQHAYEEYERKLQASRNEEANNTANPAAQTAPAQTLQAQESQTQEQQAAQASMQLFWDWVRLFKTVGDSLLISDQGLEYQYHIHLQ